MAENDTEKPGNIDKNVSKEILQEEEPVFIEKEAGGEIDEIVLKKEWAARAIAFALIGILTSSVVGHYVATMLFAKTDVVAVEKLGKIFDVWLPVITGFSGSAVTYFLTKENA